VSASLISGGKQPAKQKLKSMKTVQKIIMAGALVLALTTNVFAQINTNLQFTAVTVTDEHAIRLTWASTNSELYQIQFANALATNTDGTTAWQTLYDNYPSQGTNTFVGDFGNYILAPAVVHPKNSSMRFYRILDQGQDSLASDEPIVSIISPTNGSAAVGELTINVVASTDQPILSGTKLYVDGQEMQMADSITNYTVGSTNYEMDTYSINTCEWGNETHTLFATAENESGYGDVIGSGPVSSGHGVSPFVPVLFSNLVTRISFSQPSFDPSSGQTQQVSAVFANNSDWTLNIVDVYSNVVQTASGSGTSMFYNWDGTSNGTNLPNGIYYYYINAETNGESSDAMLSGGSSSLARSSAVRSESPELWAVAPDSENVVPFAIYPPGFDTNSLTVFRATPSEVESLTASSSRSESSVAMDSGGSFSPDASGGGSSAGSQGSPATPLRPPSNPMRGFAGTFGVAYDTYTANGTNPVHCAILVDGLGAGGHISMQGNSASTQQPFGPLPQYKREVNNFISQMQHWGWNNSFLKVDDQLNINDLRGSGTPFNNANIGVLFTHGCYGTTLDYTANGCKQMYFPITSGGGAQYLRLSEMNLGGSGTNGLKWMALNSCRSLYQANWNSMKNAGIKPYNGNLHLLMGENTDGYTSSSFGWYWAKYINFGTGTNAASFSPLAIRTAWYQAAYDAYHNVPFAGGTTINYAVAGDNACHDDTLQTNSAPGGSWFYETKQVYPLLQ